MRWLICIAALGLVMVACGDGDDGNGGAETGAGGDTTGAETGAGGETGSAIVAPDRVVEAGELLFCTSPPYPPVIFQEGDEVMGSDVDFGEAIGDLMGVETNWVTIGFDGFIAAVQGGRCDGYLGASTHTEERAEQVHFTDYIIVGRQYLVPAGNPLGIKIEEDLCGKAVSVLIGTTEGQALEELSKSYCAPNDLEGIDVQVFNQDTDAGQALVNGRVDAYGTDYPGLIFYIEEYPDQFEYALEEPVDSAPYGIATRLDDTELHAALQQAVDQLYADGTACDILAKWGMDATALQPCG